MPITAHVIVGIGGWKAMTTAKLVACPHVGDTIDAGGQTVDCERVHIGPGAVTVQQTIRFASKEEADTYFIKE